jgi:hypothetical protein
MRPRRSGGCVHSGYAGTTLDTKSGCENGFGYFFASFETGLLRMQGEILHAFRTSRQKTVGSPGEGTSSPFGEIAPESRQEVPAGGDADELAADDCRGAAGSHSRDIALSYLRLANLDNELIDRLSRYEAGLWRQTVQTLFALQTLERRQILVGPPI